MAVYWRMGDPPVLAGAVNVTVAKAFPATAETLVGAPGIVAGVVGLVKVGSEGPIPLIALTANVYAVPLVSPGTVMGELIPVIVISPGLEVTL
jgi:hypothetical protein